MTVFAKIARKLSQRRNVSLFSLLVAGLLIDPGCIPASYERNAGTQEPINDVQYLESYGEWFEMPPYGDVWRPFVVSDWAPFSHGHWMWTNDGWAWVSYEPFGWLVYHYGFWDYRREIGWFWVPGDAWSPARVEWYTFDDYCAWAPLPPPDVYWPAPWEPFDTDLWIVVEIDEFTDDDIGRRRITKPLPRELAKREGMKERPPDIRIIREREKEPRPRSDPERARRDPHPAPRGSAEIDRPAGFDPRAHDSPPERQAQSGEIFARGKARCPRSEKALPAPGAETTRKKAR